MKDLANKKQENGRLTAKKIVGKCAAGFVWECLCDCGKIINISVVDFLHERTRSCGCLRVESTTKRSLIHGHNRRDKRSKEHVCYHNMISRCYHINNEEYKNYGLRGIGVDRRWLGDSGFKNFFNRYW